jgi:hypothetical protein
VCVNVTVKSGATPIWNATVNWYPQGAPENGPPAASGVTDSDGRVMLWLPPGEYVVTVSGGKDVPEACTNRRTSWISRQVTRAAQQEHIIQLLRG